MTEPPDLDNKEDPTQLSKRKKQIENMKGGQHKQPKRPKEEWTQSNEDVTLTLKVDGIKSDQLKNIDVQFADTDVTVKLPDGRSWTWNFVEEIFREYSRVKVKKQRLTLHMKKKKAAHWNSLENEPVVEETNSNKNTEIQEPAETPSILSNESDSQLPLQSEGNIESVSSSQEEESDQEEKMDKEEEPVVELVHIKQDYIEKSDEFVVHIYVKEVNKDSIMVKFEENSFRVKFQTSDPGFLKLHLGCDTETKFGWQVKLRGEVFKEKCKYILTSRMIQIYLAKKEFTRWGDLEPLKCKEAISSKSDSWVPIDKVTTAKVAASCSGDISENGPNRMDEMRRTIEKENLAEKPSDNGPTLAISKEYAQQKPTCKVQPLNKTSTEVREQVVTPGYTGLDNLGNTCFMNGVLQCLANTREFRDIFIQGDFQKDLNTDNVLGSGGKLAVAFGVLMKVLWSGKHFSYATSKLKTLVAQKASQFTGFAQHDSQEFLAFLLDGLHEDLNRIKKKPYTETVEDHGRSDEVVANEAWAVHKRRNDSYVVDLFQGQYKSKLVCPVCGKVSITFDPFLYLSLPLPKEQRLLPVTFMWKDPYKRPVRYMLKLSKGATVEALKEGLLKKTGVHPNNIRVFEAYKGRIHKIFGRGISLSLVQANDTIIACEVLSEEMAGEPVFEVAVVQRTLMPNQFPTRCQSCKKLCPEGSKLKRCTKCLKVGYCDQACQKNHWQSHRTQCKALPEPVGMPFIISIPESRATFSKICQLMESYARYSVHVFQPPLKTEVPQKLSSQLSSSNLSNSSQSSGSLNSLDSQSSFSSSCTITAEQEQNLEDTDMVQDCGEMNKSQIRADDSQLSRSNTESTSESGEPIQGQFDSSSSSETELDNKTNLNKEKDLSKVESGYQSMTDLKHTSSLSSSSSGSELGKSLTASCVMDKDFTSPVKPVMGIQSGDTERLTPMFFIKPVNSEGEGITGTDGERLEDKGDVALNLTNKFFLSVDWKNNDKLPGYVLVQSKDIMEFENDTSMMTASLEECNNTTLEQCMELFTEPEVLSPEEAWYCPSCKEHREATKQLSTWRLPHTLIIQLKRFSFRNVIWRDKIDKMVEFPIRGLDLSAYYIGSRPSNETPPIYDLYGVVNHHGGILGGHYTSFVRCADETNSLKNEVGWRLCDDSRVSSISHEKNVQTRAAYLLFYRRREVFIPPPSAGIEIANDDDDEDDDDDFKSVTSEAANSSEEGGELIIDTSSKSDEGELELPDLENSDDKDVVVGGREAKDSVPVIVLDDDFDLGYTDMDSVD